VGQAQVDATEAIANRLLSNAAAFEASLQGHLPPLPQPPPNRDQDIIEEEVLEQGSEVDQRWQAFAKRQRRVCFLTTDFPNGTPGGCAPVGHA